MDENVPPPIGATPSSPPPPPVPAAAAPSTPPPVIAPAPASGRSRSGRGWMVFAIVLLVLLAFSFLLNFTQLAGSVFSTHGGRAYSTAGPRLDEAVLEDNSSANKIAIIEINGIISDGSAEAGSFGLPALVKAQLKDAEGDDRVKAVILKVDSPGGEVLASDEIYQAIAKFQDKSKKPVIASMGSLAASGGYYVSAPCRWIVANELTITGSIGVIMSSWNYRGLMNKVGVVPQTYKSGRFKDMLSGSREPDSITPEERQMIQSLIDETFARFKEVVRAGRQQAWEENRGGNDKGQRLASDWTDYADGRVLSGTEALKRGFVDELGSFEQAVKRARKLAGIANANLVQYRQRYDLSDFLRLFGRSDAKSIKVELGAELPRLQAGRLYFLSPNFVQ